MGDRADLVVELLEDQGVAGGFEVGGAEEVGGLGVGEVTSQPARDGLRGPRGPRGRTWRWLGDEPVDDRRGRRWCGRRVVRRPRSPPPWTAGGSGGDAAGLPGRHLEPTRRFQSIGWRWRRSRASAISCAPADGDMPRASANSSGVNAATAGVPSPPNDSSARRAGSTERLDPGVGGGGVQVGPVGGELELAERALRSALFGLAAASFEHGDRVEVADLVPLPDRGAHGTKPSIDHRQSRPRIPCIHRGFGHRDLLVTRPDRTGRADGPR